MKPATNQQVLQVQRSGCWDRNECVKICDLILKVYVVMLPTFYFTQPIARRQFFDLGNMGNTQDVSSSDQNDPVQTGGGGSQASRNQGEGEPNRKAARLEQKSYVGTSYDNREPCVVPVVEKESEVCHAFQVEPGIKVGGEYTRRGVGLIEAWESLGTVEAMSAEPKGAKTFFTTQNMFAKCVNDAFFGHYGLRLSPDVVWQTILQGVANHVNANPEALRDKFVAFKDKMVLVVSRPNFVKSSPLNDWPGVFPDFVSQIEANTHKGVVQLLQADFSTTCATSRIVSQIALMDTVKAYFEYTMVAGCGFPKIELTGCVADWEHIRAKAEKLREFDMDFWLDVLLPVLDEFVMAARKEPNLAFWRSLVTSSGASGMPGDPVTGWLQAFFPYLNASGFQGSPQRDTKLKRNTTLANYQESMKTNTNLSNKKFPDNKVRGGGVNYEGMNRGTKIELFPPSLCTAPVLYVDTNSDKSYDMMFCGGVTAIVQHEDMTLEPVIGWAVIDKGEVQR